MVLTGEQAALCRGHALVIQRHDIDVALGRAAPLVSGREGLATLKAVAAIKRAASTGERVDLE